MECNSHPQDVTCENSKVWPRQVSSMACPDWWPSPSSSSYTSLPAAPAIRACACLQVSPSSPSFLSHVPS